jgi:hypothetical protein
MPLAVLPALVPDVEEVYRVQFDAFKDEPLMRFLYPGGVDREAHRKGTIEWWNHDKNGHHFKCVDLETGKIVGMASWEVFWKPNGEEGYEKPAGIPWLEGKDKERCEAVLGPMWDLRERLFGKRQHICKSMDPEKLIICGLLTMDRSFSGCCRPQPTTARHRVAASTVGDGRWGATTDSCIYRIITGRKCAI